MTIDGAARSDRGRRPTRGSWTSWRTVVTLLAALLLAACSTPDDVQQLTAARYRWVGQTERFEAITLRGDEPPGRGATDTLEVCFDVPGLSAADPALLVPQTDALVAAHVGGVAVPLMPDSGLVPLPPGAREACLTYRGWHALEPSPGFAGSQRAIMRRFQRGEISHFAAGLVFAASGVVLALASLRRRATRSYLWIGVLCLTLGVLSVARSDTLRPLILASPELWRIVRGVTVCLFPLGILMFIRDAFGDTPRRALCWLAFAHLALAALALAADALHLASILKTRRLSYALLLGLVFFGTRRVLARIREGDRAARIFLGGALALLVISVPDILSGLGVLPVTSFGWSNFGVLLFVVALGAIVELRYGEQRDQLLATTDRLRDQVSEVERRREEIEALAEELRHQLERRSRELREALGASARATSTDPTVGELAPGDIVDLRYRITARLGGGAMGVVYATERLPQGRAFALKVMTGVVADHAARFAREAEIAAKARHPNLVPLVDVGMFRGKPYLVMELVRGPTLEDMRSRFGDATWGLGLIVDIAKGLEELHRLAVVHRDLKPSNVLLDAADPEHLVARLADFGVARPTHEPQSGRTFRAEELAAGIDDTAVAQPALTAAGDLVGTPRYIPPEAARGETSLAADAFALGIVIHEVLTGEYPFEVPPVFTALAGQIPVPRVVLSGPLGELTRALLDADPTRRPSMRDVVQRLERATIRDDSAEA